MAIMTDPQRAAARRAFVEAVCSRGDEFGSMTKQDVRDAIDATDQFISDSEVSYGAVLSSTYKLATTKAQRNELYKIVADARHKVGV